MCWSLLCLQKSMCIHEDNYIVYFRDYHQKGGTVASWSARSTPGNLSPGRGHCVVFLGKTLYFHGASLHPGV